MSDDLQSLGLVRMADPANGLGELTAEGHFRKNYTIESASVNFDDGMKVAVSEYDPAGPSYRLSFRRMDMGCYRVDRQEKEPLLQSIAYPCHDDRIIISKGPFESADHQFVTENGMTTVTIDDETVVSSQLSLADSGQADIHSLAWNGTVYTVTMNKDGISFAQGQPSKDRLLVEFKTGGELCYKDDSVSGIEAKGCHKLPQPFLSRFNQEAHNFKKTIWHMFS